MRQYTNGIISCYLVIILCFFIQSVSAQTVPTNPSVSLNITGTTIDISWSADNADTYILYAAPYPDASVIYDFDMGNQTSASFDLPAGSAYYVAIRASNSLGLSDWSNIEYFDLSQNTPPSPPVALGKTNVTMESGRSETISISGGTGYYTVNTSNSQVATADISGTNMTVTGLSSGSATITVSDTGGETATISVTVSSPTTPSINCAIDSKTIDTYSVGFYSWNHSILSGCAASSAEIELNIKVWTFNDYGTLDLFCSNSNTFDYGSATTASKKTGFIRRITKTTTPDSSTYYTITSTLNATQLGWLKDDGVIYFALIGYPYNMYGWPAQFDLSKSALEPTK